MQAQCQNILNQMETKIEHVAFLSFRITEKTEFIMRRFLSELFDQLSKKMRNKARIEQVLDATRHGLYPFSLVTWQTYKNTFPSQLAYEEDKYLKYLQYVVNPFNPYTKIRTHLIKAGEFYHPQNQTEVMALRNFRYNLRFQRT